jgi:tRNA threonylcarbamoyladenosine biosynthesis protein TsaE
MSELISWKKAYENDLDGIIYELKGIVKKPALIILSGPVGAGKTTFIKHFVGSEEIVSPTYSIINSTRDIAHADFYRIKDAEEVIHLELSLYAEDKVFFLIEWGMPFFRDIYREIGPGFVPYELTIEVNDPQFGDKERDQQVFDSNHAANATRNFSLHQID